MYEIVLMAAMTTAPATADNCGRGRCHCYCSGYCGGYCGGWCGGYGVWGGCYGGCSGWYGGCGAGMGCWRGYQGEGLPPPKKGKEGKEEQAMAPATLIVSVPANARLLIDDQPTNMTSSQRVFVSPPLERGYDYVYNLKATLPGNGEPASTTRRITVRAGQTVRVNLDVPAAAAATD